MRLTLPWLGCVLLLAMAGCSPDPTAAELHAARLRMDPVIAFLDSYYVAAKRPLPTQLAYFNRAYREKTQADYPAEVNYIGGQDEGLGRYRLWMRVKGRATLEYVSKTDPHGYDLQGWWLDYHDENPPVQVADP